MGWKANCILINSREDAYLGTCPPHSSRRARGLLRQLGLRGYRSAGLETSIEYALNPESLIVGAYDAAAVIGLPQLPLIEWPGVRSQLSFIATYFRPQAVETRRLLAAFPDAKILCLMLHSVINLFGYAYYDGGELRRARAGTTDDGVFLDEGEMLPEEQPYFAQSEIRDGKEVFFRAGSEFTADAIGEEFVFGLSKRFLGKSIDDMTEDWPNLTLERFRRRAWWPWRE